MSSLWHLCSVMGLALQAGSYGRVGSFFHVGSQAHPLDVEGHGPRTEEFAVNVIHLLDCPPMRVLEGWVTIFIEAGHVAAMAARGCPDNLRALFPV